MSRKRVILLAAFLLMTSLTSSLYYLLKFGPTHPPNRKTASFGSCSKIYDTICHHPEYSQDPTGDVRPDLEGERYSQHLLEMIQHSHPRWTSEQIETELINQLYDPKSKRRLISTFKWVKRTLLHWVETQTAFNTLEKYQLQFQIKKVSLELPPPASLYADDLQVLHGIEVYYQRTTQGQRRLRVGGGYLHIARSRFNLIFTLSHELAHAIDPCELRTLRLSLPAYDRLSACLMKQHLVSLDKTRSECGDNDQLSEAFSDWVAVQITAKALHEFSSEFDQTQLIKAAKNSIRDLCDQNRSDYNIDTATYPTPKIRIEQIFSQHPDIQAILGCTPTLPQTESYCSFN